MENLILSKLKDEDFIGIIPVSPVNLKMKFNNTSFSPNFWAKLLMFLISLPITIPLLAIMSFFMANAFRSGSIIIIISSIILFFVVIALPTYLIYILYIKVIKKYPDAFLAVTKEDLHFIIIKDNQIELHYKFGIPFDNLKDNFYGEINKKTKIIKSHFEIRVNNEIKLKGKLKISNNKFNKANIKQDYLLPFSELENIYLG